MSDHEGLDADVWEEGNLPAAPPLPSGGNDSIVDAVHTASANPQLSFPIRKPRPAAPMFPPGLPIPHHHVPTGPRAALRAKETKYKDGARYHARDQILGRKPRHGEIAVSYENTQILPPSYAAKESFYRKDAPRSVYVFQTTWKTIVSSIGGSLNDRSYTAARRSLDEIGYITESYIAIPQLAGNQAWIWGDQNQVMLARTALDKFERNVHEKAIKPKQEAWAESKALDGRRENRRERQAKAEAFMKQHRQSASSREYDFEYNLLWPRHLDIEAFKADHDLTTMDEMRVRHYCVIEYDIPNSVIRVSAQNERTLADIVGRLVNIARETVAKLNSHTVQNLVTLPGPRIHRDRVSLDRDPITKVAFPAMKGKELKDEQTEDFERLKKEVDKNNRKTVEKLIHRHLKILQVSEMHVRMRVTFGELGFTRYKAPDDGEESHSFGGFCEMVKDDRTTLSLQGLKIDGANISLLVDELAESELLSAATEKYSVFFDFRDGGSTLRLETEFRSANDGKELEVSQQRWTEFRPGAEHDLLRVNVLDFERPDWQLCLRVAKLPSNSKTSGSMGDFEGKVDFTAPTEGIKSPPQRRAVFPPGNRGLKTVTEVSILKFEFKESEGFFELRRSDVYDCSPGKASSLPIMSDWTASYYYSEWDNLLGDFAYLKPGDQLPWSRTLATLFPGPTNNTRSKGFRGFMNEIQQIQEMLGQVLSKLHAQSATVAPDSAASS